MLQGFTPLAVRGRRFDHPHEVERQAGHAPHGVEPVPIAERVVPERARLAPRQKLRWLHA